MKTMSTSSLSSFFRQRSSRSISYSIWMASRLRNTD